MRKERLIVPVLAVLAIAWLVAQLVSSVLFERSLSQALSDLQARGEWRVKRVENDAGWLSSEGRILLSPLLGRPWRLELDYDVRHGILSSEITGTLRPRLDGTLQKAVGEVGATAAPRLNGRYHTYSGRYEMRVALAPLTITQHGRELAVRGARVKLRGVYGDWRLAAELDELSLTDHGARLALGPATLESRYTYIDEAYHFNQHDKLRIEALSLDHPDLALESAPLVLHTDMALDERELRIDGELILDNVWLAEEAPDTPALHGRIAGTLSRLDADAVRRIFARLRQDAARGDADMPVADDALERLSPLLRQVLSEAPRLDIEEIALTSPLLDIAMEADGALFFDARKIDDLDLARLDEPEMQARFLRRLNGDITWRDAPAVAALWLGLPLGERELTFDLIRGDWRVNGRPLPDW
ncbi:DUF945 family protein [Halomonas piscis]|uniref:DUF945 family protein n=1 Tax=Halomonas piscis TaxID=3031727 RepID=A0ABY9Z278_9GAMM|nr:DUF945 family protein [Halomonas piscis]WNK21249.1 DUF945 family protein [Halomonas piscis]